MIAAVSILTSDTVAFFIIRIKSTKNHRCSLAVSFDESDAAPESSVPRVHLQTQNYFASGSVSLFEPKIFVLTASNKRIPPLDTSEEKSSPISLDCSSESSLEAFIME